MRTNGLAVSLVAGMMTKARCANTTPAPDGACAPSVTFSSDLRVRGAAATR